MEPELIPEGVPAGDAEPYEPPLPTEEDERAEADYLERLEADRRRRLDALLASDDALKTAGEQLNQLTALVSALTQARDGYMRKANEAVRLLKEEQNRTARMGKKLDAQKARIEALEGENEGLRERIAIVTEGA